ncbi:type I polyketide synthase [Bosea psychrotolerans]|uniref:Acyl transferase domain-containing protein n=1 Tax=Bosea psychrotolerans TaxID=1871628 RepID=A0A2S4MEY9_9HYPH|nr:type I polyketide synthase [Bosea psychrotolerans]POR53320.1 acyl transferase domain-containing protein [Bosea psychrotolerans]
MPRSIQSPAEEVAIIGASCILPGAKSLEEFWKLLLAERNVISPRPHGRWNVERFLRPGKPTSGFSYTFAGGYIDDAFAFDPIPFGISPREAQQMDPQQRLLLCATWRAFEDAGLPPSSLAGQNVGVFVGASAADYQSVGAFDPAVIGSHFMTGNALSILANRVSYVFDLKGPSFTVDTACSSSFVALAQAMAALRAGDVDMAIVGGVNMLLSPVPFIGFSQARMLSPTGLCRPFSDEADGYVRSEGAVVLVLQRLSDASVPGRRVRSVVVAAATNSDGRTNGISLPSQQSQQQLIEDVYAAAQVDPENLAFVEAHGTGTKIGDPIEAAAIGQGLGKRRSAPLPIGSVKSNIGHLEAASGLAALLKACMALEHGVVPRSLFARSRHGAIDFEGLNLTPITGALPVSARDGSIFAGVCNYGFGGTNGHAILRSASVAKVIAARPLPKREAEVLLVSASTAEGLQLRAHQIAGGLASGLEAPQVATALAYQHELMPHRLAIPLSPLGDATHDAADALRAFGAGTLQQSRALSAIVHGAPRRAIFVFSGNGGQYPQMGRLAYQSNAAFRREIDEIDRLYQPLAGWSLAERLRDGVSVEQLEQTSVAQPLIFAVQSALSAVLKQYGVEPLAAIGHSVGEIAAAECCGFISRVDALRILQIRSEHQEFVRGMGRMLVLAADPASVQDLIDGAGASAVDFAAYNSAASVTVSGPADQIAAIAQLARQRRVASVLLNVDYPFHSRALDGVEAKIVEDLSGFAASAANTPLYSTVTGRSLAHDELDARYWWDNIRRPVRFVDAVEAALAAYPEAAVIELAPRAILLGPISDILRARDVQNPLLQTLSASDPAARDPIRGIAARIAAHGLKHDMAAVFGDAPRGIEPLLPYPFQMGEYRFEATSEALSAHGRLIASEPLHPLLGARVSDGSLEWRNLLDPVLLPYLDDHRVDGGVVLPAAALIEMALAAGTDMMGSVPLELGEFDITRAMTFGDDETREVSTRYFEHTETVEIWSRRRFAGNDWLLHARGTLRRVPGLAGTLQPEIPKVVEPIHSEAAEIYAAAERAGLGYGPRFRIVTSTHRDETVGESRMIVPAGGVGAYDDLHVLHPISLDGSFHGLFLARPQRDGERKAYLPIRFRQIRVWKPGTAITHSVTKLLRETERFKTLSVALLDTEGTLVASIEEAVFRSVHLVKPFMAERTFRDESIALGALSLPATGILEEDEGTSRPEDIRQIGLLLKAFSISLAWTHCQELLPAGGDNSFEAIAADRTVAPAAQPLLGMARDILAMAGGLESTVDGARLSQVFAMPSPEVILGTLLQRFPRANREIRLAAQALSEAGAFLRTGKPGLRSSSFAYDQWSLCTISVPLRRAVAGALAAWTASAPRKLRVLVAGDWNGGLIEALVGLVQQGRISVTLAVANAARAEEQRHWPGVGSLFDILVLDGSEKRVFAGFDALISFSMPLSPYHATNDAAVSGALGLLSEAAPILLAEPSDDVHLAFLLGASTPAVWQDREGSSRAAPDTLQQRLEAARATDIVTQQVGEGSLNLASARAGRRQAPEAKPDHVAIVAEPAGGDLRARFGLVTAEVFDRDQLDALGSWLAALPAGEPATIVVAPEAPDAAPCGRLAARIEALAALLKLLGDVERPCRMIVLTEAARVGTMDHAGEDAGVWAFMRVAINEFPEIDLRLVDVESASAAARVSEILSFDDTERELRITATGIEVNRIRRGLVSDTPLGQDERAVLHFADGVGLDGFEWHRQPRRAPADGEIEVEVVAAGLNYRDVMVGLGVLDDDLLGAGLTRAALGFECSGRVLRVGPGVTQHRPGDAVMGFAAGAFASHIVCPDWHFFPVPDTLDLEAAATIPVVFATAWYALVERGHIRPGEDVLVHGAAGGVGLAAIQIAKLHQARVLGTASNEARRAIAKAAGADEVFDSRQERFAGAIREHVGSVDVVLNSLAGSAMLASFKLLKPFGRFLELGKRDFLDNTQLALRPFLRNIAYSGVDLDELLAADPGLVREMMSKLSEAFRSGALRPLTYRSFESYEVGAAFRSMQASEHVGKIVIRPPSAARVDIASLSYKVRPGLYAVVGGTAGLGFATAQWLARKGASHIALLSRRGVVEEALVQLLAEMRASGVQVVVEALDVGDAAAVREAVTRLTEAHGPLRGVVHAAVHLDDGLIANLSPERLQAVLRTKVDGIVNLDEATRDQPLDVFVAYSSATTLVGSPGQAAYVAANGFLEGFMRRRRELGKPALAIGWGAISDVGIIARDKQLGQRLRRTTGVVPMRSFEALAHLGRLLSLGNSIEPVQFLAGIAQGGGAEKLALLRSAAFIDLGFLDSEARRGQTEELASDLHGKSREEAIEIVTGILRREVAEILRMAESKIDLARPLAELGLDSLMALELHMALETAIGVQIAVVGAGDRNLGDMAAAIVGQLNQAQDEVEEPTGESMQSTIVRLASVHSTMELSQEEAGQLEQMVRKSSRGVAR